MNELLKEEKFEINCEKNEKGQLIFKNAEQLKNIVLEVKQVLEDTVVDAEFYKEAKSVRASLNKTKKEIISIKTSFINDYVYDYDMKSKELNIIIQECSDIMDKKIKDYEASIGTLKPKLLTVTFKTYDEKIANKIISKIEKEYGVKGEIK